MEVIPVKNLFYDTEENGYYWIVKGDGWDTLYEYIGDGWYYVGARETGYWDHWDVPLVTPHRSVQPIAFNDLPDDVQQEVIVDILLYAN